MTFRNESVCKSCTTTEEAMYETMENEMVNDAYTTPVKLQDNPAYQLWNTMQQ